MAFIPSSRHTVSLSDLVLYLWAAKKSITRSPFIEKAQVRSLTNALLGKGLNIDQLGGKLLLGILLLTQEGERQDLADRVVVGNELRKLVSTAPSSMFLRGPYHSKTVDTETPTTSGRHYIHSQLLERIRYAYTCDTYGHTRAHSGSSHRRVDCSQMLAR